MRANGELIRLENITKRFGGLTALNGVSFSIGRGEVHAVVGENGAGKSTLMKILAGVHPPDEGDVYLNGQPVRIRDPLDARRKGISIVFQELNLFPHLTVAGNIFANREPVNRLGLLDERAMAEASRKVLDAMGVALDPRVKVGRLTVGEKQLVEIARTLQQQADIIIMDEPNSALTERESARLFAIIRLLRDQGITILYVSHRLEEVFAISDRITVLRDGRYVGTWPTAETTIPEIIRAMVGRRLEESFPERTPVPTDSPVLLEVRDLTKGARLGPINIRVRAGEILGFAGLEGSGVDEVFHILFGLERMTSGEIVYEGHTRRFRSPVEAIRQRWGLIPPNRREQGLMMDWSIRKNTTLTILDRLLNRLGLLDGTAERRTTEDCVRRLRVATDSIDKRVVNLSGGNQQKVVLAKWLATGPKVLLLNDPTRGVDVGAKAEIYQLCHQLARQGLALLLTSSEVEETLGLCDRVLVLYKGKIIREFPRGRASKADVMHAMSGGAGATGVAETSG
jgi:ABC-type sugar transport system ATPase subunit